MGTTELIAQGWRDELEHEPDCWGMRVFHPQDGGYVWRNRATREFYARSGFFPSETMPWAGVKSFFTEAELVRLHAIWERAYATQEPVHDVLTFASDRVQHTAQITFIFVHGTLELGVLITHSTFS
jgi:hypothetical protein